MGRARLDRDQKGRGRTFIEGVTAVQGLGRSITGQVRLVLLKEGDIPGRRLVRALSDDPALSPAEWRVGVRRTTRDHTDLRGGIRGIADHLHVDSGLHRGEGGRCMVGELDGGTVARSDRGLDERGSSGAVPDCTDRRNGLLGSGIEDSALIDGHVADQERLVRLDGGIHAVLLALRWKVKDRFGMP